MQNINATKCKKKLNKNSVNESKKQKKKSPIAFI